MPKHRRSNIVWGLAVAGSLLLAAGGAAAGTAGASAPTQNPTKTIKLADNSFSPKQVTITAGTVVTFQWAGSNTHNVTVSKGPEKFTSPNQSDGTYDHTFKKTGTYKIVCTFHPGMNLTVKVKKPPPATTTTTTTATPPTS